MGKQCISKKKRGGSVRTRVVCSEWGGGYNVGFFFWCGGYKSGMK